MGDKTSHDETWLEEVFELNHRLVRAYAIRRCGPLRQADPAAGRPDYTASERAALLARAKSTRPSRRRPALRIGAMAAASGLVAGLGYLGITGNIAMARAQEVLQEAAINAMDEPSAPGQWWELKTTGTSAVTSYAGIRPRICVVEVTWIDYVDVAGNRPAWSVREPAIPAAKQIMDDNGCDYLSGQRNVWTTNLGRDDIPGSWQSPNAAFLNSLPRDVAALRERLFADVLGHGTDPNSAAFTYAADLLRSGLVPADLRSALFEVLRSVDGIQVADETLVDGKPAVVLGIKSLIGYVQRVIVNPSTGNIVGAVESFSVIPVVGPTLTTQTSKRRSLLDEVPASVQAAAKHLTCQVDAMKTVDCVD